MLTVEQVLLLILAAWCFAYYYIALKVSGVPMVVRGW